MPRSNRVKSWSRMQARVQDEAISKLQQVHLFRLWHCRIHRINPHLMSKVKSRKSKFSYTSIFMLLRTLSATGQRQISGAMATPSMTLQEQEESPKIRMVTLLVLLLEQLCDYTSVVVSKRQQIQHLNVYQSWYTHFSPYTCFQPYQEIPHIKDYKGKKK